LITKHQITPSNLASLCIRSFLIILVGNLLLISPSFGQSNQIKRLDISPNDLAWHFTLLSDGFYWYGNSSGLYRFDGQQASRLIIKDYNSTIEHDQYVASKIYPDTAGSYWFTTYQALHSLNPLTGKFQTFRIEFNDIEVDVNYMAFHFDEERQEILLRADTSIFAFDTHRHNYRLLKAKTTGNSFHSLAEENSTLFFAAPWWNADGIESFRYTKGAITDFRKINIPIMVKSIVAYTVDSLILATPDGLQLLTAPLSGNKQKLELSLSGTSFHVAKDAKDGSIYVSMGSKGVFKYRPSSNSVTGHWSQEVGLSGKEALNLAPDGKGNVFISYLTGGVDVILAKGARISYAPLDDNSTISDIAPLKNGSIFCLSNDGRQYLKNSFEEIVSRVGKEKSTGIIKGIIGISSNGNICVHGESKLATLSSTGTILKKQKTENSIYRGVIVFSDGEKLMLSNKGILSVKKDSLPNFLSIAPHGPNDYFSYLIKLSDDRFLASYRQVALWDFKRTEKGWEIVDKTPIPGETQTAVLYDNELFLGTSAGLFLLDQDSLSSAFNPTTTIGNLWVNALHTDNKGRLWLGTEQGLFCYYPKTGDHLYFSQADGIPDDWFIRANVIADGDSFTMATKTGLVTIDTRLADEMTSNNKIYLSDIWINGIRKTDHSLYDPQPLDLDYQHNSVSFLPGMIELSSSLLSGFRYRLRGLEEEFTHSKAGEVVRYPSIPPGSYSFEFVGVDKNGRTTKPIILPVTISPPFYQTWWFWVLCGAGLATSIYLFNRRAVEKEITRQQAIQKEEARKADEKLARHQAVVTEQRRIMRELHDDLGGTLGSLFYTLDGYLLDKESGLPVSPDLELLKNTSSDAMKKLQKVMKNNAVKDVPLPIFIRTLMEQARATARSYQLEWKVEKDDFFPEVLLKGQQVHNALLIVKEALQNIRKHAEATSFTLGLQLEGEASDTLSITLKDNGVGLKERPTAPRSDGSGNGLQNMQRRAEDLDGTLTLSTPPEGGTILQLRFPL